MVILSLSLDVWELMRIVSRARQLHRGDKSVAALDRNRGRASIFSRRGA